jgi:hypothetical protein
VLPPDTIPLYLQPGNDLSCNWYTFRVATTKCFRLMLYYPFICNSIVVRVAIDICSELQILSVSTYAFSCNPTVVRVAIDVHSELQILSASAWYYTTPFSCNPTLVRVAIDIHFELHILRDVLLLQLQPDSGSSCNRCTLRVANNECFRLILYFHFSCNPIVVGVAIHICSEL